MADFVLAAAAHDDLEEIDRYTLQTWGTEQRSRYLSALFHEFENIAAKPHAGRLRPELAEGVRSMPLLAHVIFYELHAGRCYILRVLHQRRDPNLAFP